MLFIVTDHCEADDCNNKLVVEASGPWALRQAWETARTHWPNMSPYDPANAKNGLYHSKEEISIVPATVVARLGFHVGDLVTIDGDSSGAVYEISGISSRSTATFLWLAVDDDEYDGYDGDLIVQTVGEGCGPGWGNPTADNNYCVVLCDSRSRHHGRIRLKRA